MADELEPIRQNIEINVNKKGVDEATGDIGKLNTTISSTTTATSDLSKENKKAEESFKPLKTQLKEAIQLQQRLSAQYGSTSAEATEAARSVAGIRDEIGLQRDLVNSYNPDDKFRELTQTAGLAALALGGVKDGLAAVGIESEFLDKIIGTAQALLGVTSAIGGISDAYEVLTASQRAASASAVVAAGTTEALAVAEGEATVAVTAQGTASTFASVATNALNVAMGILLSPIVLIIAAVAALVLGIGYLTGAFGDFSGAVALAEQSNKKLSKSIDDQQKSFEKSNKQMELSQSLALGLAKAHGKSADEIRKLEQALINQEVAEKRLNAVKLQSIFIEARRVAGLEDATDAQKETAKKAYEAFQKANEVFNNSLEERKKIVIDQNIAVAQEETDAREKRAAELKTANEKAKAEAERVAKEKLEARKKELADINAVADENASFIAKSKMKQEDEKKEKEAEAEEARKKKLADEIQQSADHAESQKRIDDALLQNKLDNQQQLVDSGEQLIQNLGKLAGKNKAIQKASIIAEGGVGVGKAIANTGEAVTKDLAKGFPFSAPLVALDLAVGATSVASIIKGTSQALKAVGGGSAPTGSVGGGAAPSRNVAQVGFQSSSENQISTAIAKQQKEQPPIQAFVVSQAVTDQQEIDRKKELNNSF